MEREDVTTLNIEREPDQLYVELRSTTRAHVSGAQTAASLNEDEYHHMDRGLGDGLSCAGVWLIDPTAISRIGMLKAGTTNI